jgi:hypothetical protein
MQKKKELILITAAVPGFRFKEFLRNPAVRLDKLFIPWKIKKFLCQIS